jgi:hypothetical protein
LRGRTALTALIFQLKKQKSLEWAGIWDTLPIPTCDGFAARGKAEDR